jgi:hypothetical protein
MSTLIHALMQTVRRIVVKRMQARSNSMLREQISREELQFELMKGLG